MKRPLGYFEAKSTGSIPEIVIVSQEVRRDNENLFVAARKIFTLGTVDGEEIFRTEDPQAFSKNDGTLLKKIGGCQANGSSRSCMRW